ncbi:hypothetical protein PUND_b0009 [Pseudoalteromonas undina]|uniref:LigB family enzyme n=1 Tax=Pseudoalteromonas undina TaxID=43660 RepID=A0ABN0NI10_9GAMM|nr:class III extradiol ring-cleavage dioxygenase [Pseudoalteromonas undina]KAF7762739.1 hypothetical protein PUND_b0009 [Pseudoalteromonas undina]
MQRPTVFFISHGGGPMPLLGDANHAEMRACLEQVAAKIPKPSAILMVSAHWEAQPISITAHSSPPLIYDYYGFPKQAYQLTYPCAGQPQLANLVQQAIATRNIDSKLDPQRGYDHGMFVPLKIMYPEADIPCVQISLHPSLDPLMHVEIGKALQSIDYDNLLIIGSGFTFHNMRAFGVTQSSDVNQQNQAFENWLVSTVADQTLTEQQREQQLLAWQQAPAARFNHPREEHLLPLHVCYGAAMCSSTEVFELNIANKRASMYLWQ